MRTRSVSIFRGACAALGAALVLAGCATAPKLPPPPPKYVHQQEKPNEGRTANSLWSDGGGLVEDFRARRVNDLLTINVSENISGLGRRRHERRPHVHPRRERHGVPRRSAEPRPAELVRKGEHVLSHRERFDGGRLQGDGKHEPGGKIVGTITARVTEVMPNGTLSVESRKEITINNEKQVLILRGLVRPEDISVSNMVESGKVADAQIYLVGDGVLQEKQRQGWLVRILDSVWPF